MLAVELKKQIFEFSFNARTSRGAMKDKTSWFIRLTDSENGISGIGECGPLPGLSPELTPDFEERLNVLITHINQQQLNAPTKPELTEVSSWIQQHFRDQHLSSSVLFALETAMLDLVNGGEKLIFKNSFTTGTPIPINGLIWMGGLDFMLQQIEIKIRDGFTCLKLKVGSHDFEKECDVLQYIRRKYF
ncbi:MAG TPA: o-succinylbenzoate synthase, partial [Cyclobacteriaceae bacterium]|nr:o-succinylbenzoate synthase [Cyclobacteriaceae bacterium]